MNHSSIPSINDLLAKDQDKKQDNQDSAPAKIGRKMQQMVIAEKEKEAEAHAQKLGLPYANLEKFAISLGALRALPEPIARAKKAACFNITPEELYLGVVDFNNEIEELAFQLEEKFHAKVLIYLVTEHSLERLYKLYANLPIIKPVSKDIVITDEELSKFQEGIENLQSLRAQFESVSISDVLTLIIASALKANASDIHIEAEEKGVSVRYRIDGILHEVAALPREQWNHFVARIKLLAALKININDRPQDGRVTLKLSEDTLDVRVSTLPTTWGESVVMRILYGGSEGVTYDELGLRGNAYEQLKREITRPNGMIITTGPTGSGKTTTMYAILRTLNKPGVKIITLEDPVEIKMPGINQSQVDTAKDYTFAKGLRSILRQDPDICLVGEIRDLESAEIAIQAALTGHLLLSTIHTNSASGAIPRFLSMGVKPFLLAPALNAIIGQRLVRRICENCRQEAPVDPTRLKKVQEILTALPAAEKKNVDLSNLRFYAGAGCDQCSGLGYKGRIGIYEIFTMNKSIEDMILANKVSEYTIQDIATQNGMVTMAQDGLLKALDKITTVEEVFRVTE